jgi:hypothetical protein
MYFKPLKISFIYTSVANMYFNEYTYFKKIANIFNYLYEGEYL